MSLRLCMALPALLLAACGADLPGTCADPGSFTVECVAPDGSLLSTFDGTCEKYAESGDQLVSSQQSACEQESPGCTCTADLSECEFPCGSND